jgi:integrase
MTLRELDAAYLEQYDAAPASVKWLKYNLGKGGEAVRRRADPGAERSPDRAVAGVAAATHGVLVEFLVGCGVRPEEAFGAEWPDVDLRGGIFTVQRAFAKGRLKRYAKTERPRRRVPLRARTVEALQRLEQRGGILFANQAGERIDTGSLWLGDRLLDAWTSRRARMRIAAGLGGGPTFVTSADDHAIVAPNWVSATTRRLWLGRPDWVEVAPTEPGGPAGCGRRAASRSWAVDRRDLSG